LLFNKNYDLVNDFFSKYQEMNNEEQNENSMDIDDKTNITNEQNIDILTNKLENVELNNSSIKPKRKYVINK